MQPSLRVVFLLFCSALGGAQHHGLRSLKQTYYSEDAKPQLVFIIGARRAGTEGLYDFLLQHDRVCPLPKQMERHNPDSGTRHAALASTEWFLETLASNKDHACVGKNASSSGVVLLESAPNMLVTARGTGQIAGVEAEQQANAVQALQERWSVKFLVLLREPVLRDLSWFNYQKGKGQFFARSVRPGASHTEVAQMSLKLARTKADPLIRHTLQHGYYAAQLKEWVKAWGKESTMVLSYEQLVRNTTEAAYALERFLGLGAGALSRAELRVRRGAVEGAVRREEVEVEACADLADAFAPHNADLYALLAQSGWPAAQPPFPPFPDPCVGTKPRKKKEGGGGSGWRTRAESGGGAEKQRGEVRKWGGEGSGGSRGRGGDGQLKDEFSAKEVMEYVKAHGKPPRMSTQKDRPLDIKWPTVFVIAAPKSASSSLADMLFKHPRFCHPEAPKGHRVPWEHRKEIHFFAKRSILRKGWRFYLEHFGRDPKCQGQTQAEGWYHVDGTPSYMMSRSARSEMPNVLPKELHRKLRFIAVLREPVARDLSWYNHQKSVNMSPKVRSVKSYTEYAKRGLKPFDDGSAQRIEQLREPGGGDLGDDDDDMDGGGFPGGRRLQGTTEGAGGGEGAGEGLSGSQRRLLALHRAVEARYHALRELQELGAARWRREGAAQWRNASIGEEGGAWEDDGGGDAWLREVAGQDDGELWEEGEEGEEEVWVNGSLGAGGGGRTLKQAWKRPQPPRAGQSMRGRPAPVIPASRAPPKLPPRREESDRERKSNAAPPPGVRKASDLQKRVGARQSMKKMSDRGRPRMEMTLFQGFYDRHLEDWWKAWPDKKQTIVFSYDTLMQNTSDTMRRIAEFIGVDPGPWLEAELPHSNERSYKNKVSLRDVDPDICRRLQAVYAPHNRRLYQLLETTRGMNPLQPPFPHFPDPCKHH